MSNDGIHGSSWCCNDNYDVYDYDGIYDGGLTWIATLTEEQLKLRQQVLMILFKQFGNGKYSINQFMNVPMNG